MKIITNYWPKPLCRRFDWSAYYDDYDGAEDSPTRNHIGFGTTKVGAIIDLVRNYPRVGAKPQGD